MLAATIGVLVSLTALPSSVHAGNRDPAVAIVAELPGSSRIDQPLRRGINGDIDVVDPTKQNGSGPRRCSQGAICVGKDQGYHSLSDALALAKPGMTIEISIGIYHESVTVRVANLTIRGIGGTPHIDCAGIRPAGDKACLLLVADGVTLENLDISGAVLPESDGANGACIRNGPNMSVTLRRVVCHASQDGLLTSGGKITIENSEFYDNGWTGQTHNIYLNGKCTAMVRGSTFRDARVGHEFKSRCQRTEISDSTFRSTHGSRDIDIPDGGETMVYRSLLVKTPGAESEQIIGFTPESCGNSGDMILKDTRIVNTAPAASIQNFDHCKGSAIVFEGVRMEGLPIREIGYILRR